MDRGKAGDATLINFNCRSLTGKRRTVPRVDAGGGGSEEALQVDVPDPSTTMDAAAELRRNPVSKHQIQPEYGVSRLMRDGTAEHV